MGPGVVKLFEEGGEELRRLPREADQREEPLTGELAEPDGEQADLEVVPLPVQAEEVLIGLRHVLHPLAGERLLDGGDPVPQGGRLLEVQGLGRGLHAPSDRVREVPPPAFQEGAALPDQTIVGLRPHPTDARREAAPDLEFQAGAATGFQFRVPAGPEWKDGLEEAQRLARRRRGGMGPK